MLKRRVRKRVIKSRDRKRDESYRAIRDTKLAKVLCPDVSPSNQKQGLALHSIRLES